jgi:hypothetical protein
MGTLYKIGSRILILASIGQGNLQKKVLVRRHPGQPLTLKIFSNFESTIPVAGRTYVYSRFRVDREEDLEETQIFEPSDIGQNSCNAFKGGWSRVVLIDRRIADAAPNSKDIHPASF